jgi:uncharacterized protein (DUF1810 family)
MLFHDGGVWSALPSWAKTLILKMNRFLEAQEKNYAKALSEIKKGKKQSHWIWYIFPQILGLGTSIPAQYYGIKDMREATEFLSHPILGTRLIEISMALLELPGKDAFTVLGSPDDMKLKSSMTLFSLVKDANPVFQQVLDKFFEGEKDKRTLQILG